ncbi:MAG TPA: hypothetical protein VD765_06980 [Solirubrobacterales bacterium]|nr:hypothetical protein [Solirubrobacterales bacterium]
MQAGIRRLHLLIDLRLYRLSFIPALLAVVIAMFSLEGVPDALQPVDPPTTFEGDRAAGVARQIASAAPDRTPGSAGDEAIADLVRSRFDEVPAGAVSEQTLEGTHDGEQVALRNVLLTLPGEAGETIVVTAGRDSARGAGAATSAAATGILVELANALRVSHEKTYVLASTSGSSVGADGIRALIDNLPERDSIEAVIVISQPGAEDRRPPYVVATSDAETSPNAQLVRTAEGTVGIQAAATTPTEGAFTQLARLAVPSGIGDQAPLIGDGIDAVAISSAGERPLAGEQAEALSGASVDQFGRAIQSAVDALDDAVEAPVHGPGAYLELGENLLPGWALALLAATLILPALVAAVDACARAARRELGIGTAFAWGAARSLPLIGGLAALYALALVGAIPRPPFPFDPGLYELGARAVISFVIMLAAVAATAWFLRSPLAARRAPEVAPSALGALAALSCALIWLVNPYLALFAAPAAHVWVLASSDRLRGPLPVSAGAALACVLPVAALLAVAEALGLGIDAPWTFTLMVADGQIGLLTMVAAAFLAGTLIALVALAFRRRGSRAPADAQESSTDV